MTACLDAEKGKLLWKVSLLDDFKGQVPRYGASGAPLVVGELLIVSSGGPADGTVLALDRNTGALRWKNGLSDRPAYSAPILVHAGGVDQVVVWTADSITGFNPPTGKILWQIPWKAVFDPAQATARRSCTKTGCFSWGLWSRVFPKC